MVNRNKLPREFFFEPGEKSERVRELINSKLSPFYQKTMKDIFMYSACLGYAKNKKREKDRKTGGAAVPVRVFNDDELSLLTAIAISDKKDINILLKDNIKEYVQIIEEYANGGLDLLYFQIQGGEIGDPLDIMESDFRDYLEKNYQDNETIVQIRKNPKDYLEEFENDLRAFIKKTMEQNVGQNWWKQRIPEKIRQSCEDKKQSREKNIIDEIDKFHLIYYMDFAEYYIVLTQKNNWEDIYKKYFQDTPWLQVKLNQELKEIRNDLSHSRPITHEKAKKMQSVVLELKQRMKE